ncbi:MAG: thioredoxin family protein [Saprospirales bacterium]|nr:thioredoxin family protein [Saprospirales bacterium]MBK8921594.1 thioredoxin family protein [Saprospirales bacterium]
MKKTLVFLTLAVALVAWSFTTPVHEGYHVGDTARDFNLMNVDKKMYDLAGIPDAKGYIVIFTCNHCPYAVAYQDRIIALHNKYAPMGYPVVAINPNDKTASPGDSFEGMQKRAREKKFPFLYLYDETQEIAKTYGATRTPHVYLLDKSRVVRYIGAIDDNHEDAGAVQERYLESAIDALSAGQEITLKETKAIGCTIKWRKTQ